MFLRSEPSTIDIYSRPCNLNFRILQRFHFSNVIIPLSKRFDFGGFDFSLTFEMTAHPSLSINRRLPMIYNAGERFRQHKKVFRGHLPAWSPKFQWSEKLAILSEYSNFAIWCVVSFGYDNGLTFVDWIFDLLYTPQRNNNTFSIPFLGPNRDWSGLLSFYHFFCACVYTKVKSVATLHKSTKKIDWEPHIPLSYHLFYPSFDISSWFDWSFGKDWVSGWNEFGRLSCCYFFLICDGGGVHWWQLLHWASALPSAGYACQIAWSPDGGQAIAPMVQMSAN